jgi:hypothetical protein
MKKILVVAFLLFGAPLWATVSWLHTANGTAATLTISSTTSGNPVVVMVSSNGATPSVSLSSPTQAMTELGSPVPHLYSGGTLYDAVFYVTSATGGQTTATCTGCTSPNAMAEGEASGVGAPYIDTGMNACTSYNERCQVNGAATAVGVTYNPGYSSEAVMALSSCSNSSGTPTFTNLTSTSSALPNSNAVGWGISSGASQVAMISTSGCGSADGLIVGVVGSGATQQLTSNQAFQSDAAVKTSGSLTLTVHVANTGDLFVAPLWCLSTCGITTATLGSQNLTCPSLAQGFSSSFTGQGFLCYVVTNTSGALTLTFTPSGSPSQWQALAYDMPVSGQTSIAFDTAAVDHCDSSCTEGTTITTPSLTASGSGELFLNFVYTQHHVVSFNGSWGCNVFSQVSGDILSCFGVTTVNGLGWIANAGSATEAPNATVLDSNDPFQSIVAAFKYSSTAGGAVTNSAAPSWF